MVICVHSEQCSFTFCKNVVLWWTRTTLKQNAVWYTDTVEHSLYLNVSVLTDHRLYSRINTTENKNANVFTCISESENKCKHLGFVYLWNVLWTYKNNRDTSLLIRLSTAILFVVSLCLPLPCLLMLKLPLYSSDYLPSLVRCPQSSIVWSMCVDNGDCWYKKINHTLSTVFFYCSKNAHREDIWVFGIIWLYMFITIIGLRICKYFVIFCSRLRQT